MTQETLSKQRFWILFGITVPLVLLCMLWLSTSVATENFEKRVRLNLHKEQLDAKARADLKGTEYMKLLVERSHELEEKRLDLWQQAWNMQKDLTVWPGDLQPILGKMNFGDEISQDDCGRYENFYRREIDDLQQRFTEKFQVGNDSETLVAVRFKDASVISQVKKWDTPASDELWLAQEDIWVQRELLKAINDANNFVAKFQEAKAAPSKDGKKEEAEPNIRFQARFQNPYWILNLQLAEKGAQFVVRGTIQNRPEHRRQMMIGRLYFAMQISKDGKEVVFPIDGEPLVPGQEWPIREFPLPGLVNPDGILGVRQLFITRDAPVRQINQIALAYAAHRTFDKPLVPPLSLKSGAAAAAKGAATEKATTFKTRNGLDRDRYTEVSQEVRRMPFYLVLVVDQAHVPEVLTALANCRLRVQVTQYGWRRAGDAPAADPKAPPTGVSLTNAVELAVYGTASLYERYPEKAATSPVAANKE